MTKTWNSPVAASSTMRCFACQPFRLSAGDAVALEDIAVGDPPAPSDGELLRVVDLAGDGLRVVGHVLPGGERFDFFLAYSIWTHASKGQIGTMLDSFLRDSTENAVFVTTFLTAALNSQDYTGDKWYGTSHDSHVAGCIRHRLAWIKAECSRRDLVVRALGRDSSHDQSWLEIRRRATAPVRRRRYPLWVRQLAGPVIRARRRLRR